VSESARFNIHCRLSFAPSMVCTALMFNMISYLHLLRVVI